MTNSFIHSLTVGQICGKFITVSTTTSGGLETSPHAAVTGYQARQLINKQTSTAGKSRVVTVITYFQLRFRLMSKMRFSVCVFDALFQSAELASIISSKGKIKQQQSMNIAQLQHPTPTRVAQVALQ